jgi:hypothetical protein
MNGAISAARTNGNAEDIVDHPTVANAGGGTAVTRRCQLLDALFDRIHQISSNVEIIGSLVQCSPISAIDVGVGSKGLVAQLSGKSPLTPQ